MSFSAYGSHGRAMELNFDSCMLTPPLCLFLIAVSWQLAIKRHPVTTKCGSFQKPGPCNMFKRTVRDMTAHRTKRCASALSLMKVCVVVGYDFSLKHFASNRCS